MEQESMQAVLCKFIFPKETNTDEDQAIKQLSQFPKPAAIKSIKDEFGKTLLHHACYEGWYDASRTLVNQYHVNPDAKNIDGDTPLHCACERGHLMIVQYLVEECHSDPECREKNYGWTPFQIACYYGHLDIIAYLVTKCGCDPLKTDKFGDTPLLHACCSDGKYDIVSFLLTTVKVDKLSDRKLRLGTDQMRSLVSCRRKHPFHPAFKVMVVGNQTAGKSTLVKAIEIRLTDTNVLGSLTGRFTKVTGVELRTAGIIPTHIHSTKLGHIILYDFAGQYEYYLSHAAYLENLACSPGVLFLLVVDISKSTEEIVRTLQYWNSFIDNLSHRTTEKPQIVVVGSHADVVKAQGQLPLEKLTTACKKVDSASSMATILRESNVLLDCTRSVSSSLNSLCDTIAKSSQTFHKEVEVDMQTQFLHFTLKHQFETTTVACQQSRVSRMISAENNLRFCNAGLLPTSDTSLSESLTTLSEHGQLLYLRNDQDVNDSWVILDKELLLSKVNGTIFAPNYFKQHHDISSSTGVVPLYEIKKAFPDHDPRMIVSFLTHLEFCYQIGESEASLISGRGQLKSSDSPSESYYFFPALVSEERPEESCKSFQQSCYKSGWCLERIQDDQFFTSRFLHVLFLRLAFAFALASDTPKEGKPCLIVKRECNVWKCGLTDGGIHWINMDGVEAIVEVVEQSTAVTVVVGCEEGGEMASIQLRSDLIRTILEIKEKFSGAVELRESLINPSELDSYPLKSPKELSTFSFDKIAVAISKEKEFVTCKQGFKQQHLPVGELVRFEPYLCFSQNAIHQVFDESNAKKEVGSTFLSQLSKKAHPKASELQQVLGVDSSDLQAAVRASPPSVRDVFKIWKEQGRRSYGDLKSALDKYSVFCGRNPLVLAGVSTPVKNVPSDLKDVPQSQPVEPTTRDSPTLSTPHSDHPEHDHDPVSQDSEPIPPLPPSPVAGKTHNERSMISDLTPADDIPEYQRDISATACWEVHKLHSKLDGDGIVIAVLDSGVNAETHDAFQRSYKNGRIHGLNFVPRDADSTWRTQPQEHGSMAAFVAAGDSFTDSTLSLTIPGGVAPKSKLIICRIGEGKTYSKLAVIRALKALVSQKEKGKALDIISMSFGCVYDPTDEDQNTIRDLIRQLESHKVIIVASAGNYGKYRHGVTFPAIMDTVISVGALNHKGYRRDSNAPTGIDVFGPGEGIAAPSIGSRHGVTFHNGSSCAAPAVSGLLGLVLQYSRDYVDDPREKGKYRDPLYLKNRLFREDMKRGDPDLLKPYEFFKDKLAIAAKGKENSK